jgi:hypothetical protein
VLRELAGQDLVNARFYLEVGSRDQIAPSLDLYLLRSAESGQGYLSGLCGAGAPDL